MDFQADTVARAMDKVAPQPLTLQETPGGCIHCACGHASPYSVPRRSLRIPGRPGYHLRTRNGARPTYTVRVRSLQ